MKTDYKILQWYAKRTDRRVEDLDDYDLLICRVVTAYRKEHENNFEQNKLKIK